MRRESRVVRLQTGLEGEDMRDLKWAALGERGGSGCGAEGEGGGQGAGWAPRAAGRAYAADSGGAVAFPPSERESSGDSAQDSDRI